MVDVFQIADLLVSHALKEHADEVDVIGYYGSHAQGSAAPDSDLDIFFIPADGKKPPIARTFLVEGVLFDFWAIPWGTMEGFATGRLRGWSLAPAIVHYAKLLHTRSPQQAVRFAALKQKVLDLQGPEARPQMVRRALEEFRNVLAHLGNLRLAAAGGDLADIRHAGWKLILSAWECLALANQAMLDRGWGHLVEQAQRLRSRPPDLEQMITTISTASDPAAITAAAERLAMGTREVLRGFQESFPSQRTVRDIFAGAYPEIRDGIGKVIRACERGSPVAASASTWFTQQDLSLMLSALRNGLGYADANFYSEFAGAYRDLGFPELMACPADDLPALARHAESLDRKVCQWLREQSVSLQEFASTEELARTL